MQTRESNEGKLTAQIAAAYFNSQVKVIKMFEESKNIIS